MVDIMLGMDMELIDFLVRAKISTYACDNGNMARILRDGSKELVYSKDDFRYRDRYFGYDPFVGEEIVWLNNVPVWAMNYYGAITSAHISRQEIYHFLKLALRHVASEIPFRGPAFFSHADFLYSNKVTGNTNSFTGMEYIYYNNINVYSLTYHGGIVGCKS